MFQVFVILNLSGNSLPRLLMMSSDELNSTRNTRSVQLRNNILLTGKQLSLTYVSTIQMFQGPAVVTMTIASTRMYRSLVDFTSGPPDA